jgi:hypothetical protein
LLLLSLVLQASDGLVLAEMEDNMFEVDPSRLYDLEANTGGTRLKFWLSKRNIGLDLSFKRVTMPELSAILDSDRLRAERESEQRLPDEVKHTLREAKLRPTSNWFQSLPSFQQLPDEVREAHLSGNPTGTFVKRWASSHCQDDEGRIPLLDFETLILHDGPRRIVIRNGIAADGCIIRYSSSFGNGARGFNL